MPRILVLVFLFVAVATTAIAQDIPPRQTDTLKVVPLPPVIVTATRSTRALEDVAAPTTVVTAVDMRMRGSTRLHDVLSGLTGLAMVDDHGTGLQLQGLSPDYTLILANGQPVIGQVAGTLDLKRLSTRGLERVEVVQGPFSSLYGSEALAGVVNLISRPPALGEYMSVGIRAGRFNTSDLYATLESGRVTHGARLTFSRLASSGYDLEPETYGPTTPPFYEYAADAFGHVKLLSKVTLRVKSRFATESSTQNFAIQETRYTDFGRRTEWNVHPEITACYGARFCQTGTVYATGYRTSTRQLHETHGDLLDSDTFNQQLQKAESHLNAAWNSRHFSVFGGGYQRETLESNRYPAAPKTNQLYAFLQHEWEITPTLQLGASARFDAHSDYTPRFSPRATVLWRPRKWWRIHTNLGSGFKAPALRQLYLAHNNAQIGYSVYGATQLRDGLAQLQSSGQLSDVFVDVDKLQSIGAENSRSFNVGTQIDPVNGVSVSVNGFYNDVRDLIETQPVAQKVNQQFVYGYFNIAHIYTRGLQARIRIDGILHNPVRGVLSLGYQYLQARDPEIVRLLDSGTVYGRKPDGTETRLGVANYTGLFGRSPHMLSLQTVLHTGTDAPIIAMHGRWRSRYGYRDVDGNQIANRADEFVSAYVVIDLTITQSVTLLNRVSAQIQLGLDNMLNFTHPTHVPSLPGRIVWAEFSVSF